MSVSKQQAYRAGDMARFKALLETLPAHFRQASVKRRQELLDLLEDWRYSLRREHPRKTCSVPVDFAVGDKAFSSIIKNISAGGAFIDDANGVTVGQRTTLTFWFPTLPRPTKIKGEIARKRTRGFGVRFATSPYTEAGLEKAIQRF
jgi:hypothetical protein